MIRGDATPTAGKTSSRYLSDQVRDLANARDCLASASARATEAGDDDFAVVVETNRARVASHLLIVEGRLDRAVKDGR